jgi:hypothetical protein
MNKVTSVCITLLLTLSFVSTSYAQEIQRVRVDFKTPNDFIRHLLLGFTPDNAANDGYNYGYDATAMVEYPDDLNWMIDNKRCVIQGVGEFNTNKTYPFGMFIANSGDVEISLAELENFDQPIDVYIYDALTNVFTLINDTDFSITMDSGEYLERFFITFQNITPPPSSANIALSINDNNLDEIILRSITTTNEILIDTRNQLKINKVEILDILGKKVIDIKNINDSKLRIPTQHINSKIIIVSVFTNNGIVRKKLLLF